MLRDLRRPEHDRSNLFDDAWIEYLDRPGFCFDQARPALSTRIPPLTQPSLLCLRVSKP